MKLRSFLKSRALLLPLGIGSTLLAVSCMTTSRTMVVPLTNGDASYVGSAECAECHKEVHSGFGTAAHARLDVMGVKDAGCESCHGPGSKHVEIGGSKETILNPRNDPSTCFQCHLDVRGQMSLPNHHPVANGQVNCGDCHDPHRGAASPNSGTVQTAQADNCAKCHMAQSGPFVFEHEALRDGCSACHAPHGSINDKMLKVRNANLCLQCHMTERVGNTVYVGGRDHTSSLNRGTCWVAGCHEAVHGSNVNSSLRY